MLASAALILLALNSSGESDFERDVRPFLAEHCLECHGPQRAEGELELKSFLDESAARSSTDFDWAYLRERVDYDEMPPRGRPRPQAEDTDRFLAWIDAAHGLTPPAQRPLDPGRPVLRRLNHTEYHNTIRDLLGVELPTDELFPVENVGHGFDHIGESLSLPDALFEKYVLAAERVASEAWMAFGPEDVETRRYDSNQLEGSERGGFIALTTNAIASAMHEFPIDGRYLVRVGAFGQQAGPELCRLGITLDGVEQQRFEVPNVSADLGVFEAELEVSAGRRSVGGAFLNDYYRPQAPAGQRDRNLYVGWVEVHGPLDAPRPTALQATLRERFPESLGQRRLRAVLEHFATALWRRPATSPQLHRVEQALDLELSFDKQVQDALMLLLVSPDFLFRFERAASQELQDRARRLAGDKPLAAEVTALDGHELAVRLAYFLWSTAPDAQLRDLAASGALLEDAALREQTERLLADRRAWNFTLNFGGQWLQLRRLERRRFDPELHAELDAGLRDSMIEETLRVFDALLRERRDVRELLDADFTFVDDALATHYGLELERDAAWTRVELRGPRRGLIGHASILTLTSEPTRTSPVKRGKWLLETLLNAAPAPPPANAGSFENNGVGASAASLREELALHRARQECATCHDAMDPLGLALENFGPTGAWRDEDQGQAIDATGELPDGSTIDGLEELRRSLREDPAFERAVLEKLYVYALGRPCERSDRPLLDALSAGLDPHGTSLADLIHAIVQSPAFRLRRTSR